jgi:PDZ domain/C2 domain
MSVATPLRGCLAVAIVGLATFTSGCVKNQDAPLATKLSPSPKGVNLTPEPPADLYWIRVASAKVPLRDTGGQLWDELGAFPDPYVILKVNGKPVIESPPVENTLKPTWTGPGGNYVIEPGDKVEIELKDADTLHDLQMGRATLDTPGQADVDLGRIEIDTGNRGKVVLEIQAAHALLGLGFDYTHYDGRAAVNEVWQHSPAGRGGLERGDKIVQVAGRDVKAMKAREIRSAINSIGGKPVDFVVKHGSGNTETVKLQVGPIYPLVDEYGLID